MVYLIVDDTPFNVLALKNSLQKYDTESKIFETFSGS